jgi:hypothetical protein
MNIVGKIVGSRNDIASAANPLALTNEQCIPRDYDPIDVLAGICLKGALPSCSGEPTSSDTSLTPNAFAAASASRRCGGLDALFM